MGKIGQNTNRIESKPTNHALSPKHIKINLPWQVFWLPQLMRLPIG